MEWQKDGYEISTDRARVDIDYVHRFLHDRAYWAQGIPRERVATAIEHSLCFGVYAGSRQVGFARLVTDYAVFAYLADVFIDEAHRGRGLSKWLVGVIVAYPELPKLRRWLLGTRDAHALYAKFGFTADIPPGLFMHKLDPSCYSSST